MIIGITGGIGTGKTTLTNELSRKLEEKNVSNIILNTDEIAKQLQLPNFNCYNKIIENFGLNILNKDKTINYGKLGEIVLNDKLKLEILNSIVHPEVINYLKKIINKNKYEVFIIESALLIESNINLFCDYTISVMTNINIRRTRLKKYRNYSDEKIDEFMKNQKDEDYYLNNSNFICTNNYKEDLINFIDTFIDNTILN